MENERDKQPIDDLFARKLGKMSLPPSADGFDRLQARMAQQAGTPIKVAFWHNPTIQLYMAAAACLLMVCLFGWLYWPTGVVPKNSSVATRQTPPKQKAPLNLNRNPTDEQVAAVSSGTDSEQKSSALPKAYRNANTGMKPAAPIATNRPTSGVAQVQPTKNEPVLTEPTAIASANSPQTSQSPESTPKPTPQAERVLVVTIEEPAVLVAARQGRIVAEEQPVVATADKPAKEVKGGNLWQKMKQLKQGELLAKSDNPTDDEHRLLSRAYTGLKHSFEKGKTTKQ